MVGVPGGENQCLSGGERKRLSLCMEVLLLVAVVVVVVIVVVVVLPLPLILVVLLPLILVVLLPLPLLLLIKTIPRLRRDKIVLSAYLRSGAWYRTWFIFNTRQSNLPSKGTVFWVSFKQLRHYS